MILIKLFKNSLVLSIFVLLFISCEKEIILEQDEIAPRIVVNAIISASDTIWIDLSESRPILYEDPLPPILVATAQLVDENETEIGTFTSDGNGKYFLTDVELTAGNTYGLKVNAPDFTDISAFSNLPTLTTITSIDTTTDVPYNQIEFTLQFNDNPANKDYYSVMIEYFGSWLDEEGEANDIYWPYFSTNEFYVNASSDIDGAKYEREFLFSDESFNGNAVSFTGLQGRFTSTGEPGYYVITLKTMSEDVYKYKVSYQKYQNSQGPFAEPVQVYSNISEGFGIFGGMEVYRDTLWMIE
jgi:hypothetical protein